MTLQAESKTRVTSGIWLGELDVFMVFRREEGERVSRKFSVKTMEKIISA